MLIFDFDQTLVDTQPVEKLRKERKWSAVLAQAPRLKVYDGITHLLNDLHSLGQKMAIVTKSPDMIPKAFIQRYEWPIDNVVGYHQVKNQKPHPEGLILAMTRAGVNPSEVFHIGDKPEDTEASKAAKVTAIGSTWGLSDSTELQGSNPDYLFSTVGELRTFLLSRVKETR